MKLITDHLGQIIAVIAAISLLITSIVFFKGPVGFFFENIIEKETSIGDKVFANLDDVGMFEGEGGSGGTGGSGGADHDAPTLTVGPELSQDINLPTVVQSNTITLSGTVSDTSGIASLTVNGNDVTVDASGAWSYTLELTQNEVTEVTIEAKDNAGNTATKSGYVGYIIYTEAWVGYDAYAEEIGYTDTTTVLEIPATFKKDDTWYKVTMITASGFSNCTNLTSITIPNSVTSIGASAFQDCTSLTSITIPDSVTTIKSSVFKDCTSLTSVTIPRYVTSIGDYALQGCTNLTSITIPNSVTSIGNCALQGCTNLTSITIPNSVTSIGAGAFQNCTSLTSITIPNDIKTISNSVFKDCTNLTSVTFGVTSQLTGIYGQAFRGCTNLTNITIPDSVTLIGSSAFRGCTNLTSVTFEGTGEQWNAITKQTYWNNNVPATKVVCSDGEVSLK